MNKLSFIIFMIVSSDVQLPSDLIRPRSGSEWSGAANRVILFFSSFKHPHQQRIIIFIK